VNVTWGLLPFLFLYLMEKAGRFLRIRNLIGAKFTHALVVIRVPLGIITPRLFVKMPMDDVSGVLIALPNFPQVRLFVSPSIRGWKTPAFQGS